MTHYSRVPKALFDVDLDTITLACFKGLVPDPNGEARGRLWRLPQTLSDMLMVVPRLSFKVTGENVPLAALVQILGAEVVEELLTDGDLEFILWRDYVAIVQTPIDGLIPFVPGNFTNPENSDPEASNARGLLSASSLDDAGRKRLTNLATARTTTTDANGAKQAWQALVDLHKRGDLESYGVPADRPLSEITPEQKARLGLELANLHHAAELVERELDLHEAPQTWNALLLLAREVNSSPQVPCTATELLSEENAPSVGDLVARKLITPREVLNLRRSPEARAFREWLWTRRDPANTSAVLEEYRALIFKERSGIENRLLYRAVRVTALSAVAAEAERAVTGTSGAAAGATVALGIGLIDEVAKYVRESRSPRRLSGLLREQSKAQERVKRDG